MDDVKELLRQWWEKFGDHYDAGPGDYGWQSEEFCELIRKTERALAVDKPDGEPDASPHG